MSGNVESPTSAGVAGESDAVEPGRVRQLWHLLEPLHALLYHAPEAFEEAAALGYGIGERWPSYFPYRAAPLGAVGGERAASRAWSPSTSFPHGASRVRRPC